MASLVALPGDKRAPAQLALPPPKPLPWPHAHALTYASQLTSLVKRMEKLVNERLIPKLPKLVDSMHAPDTRQDDVGDTLESLLKPILTSLGMGQRNAQRWAKTMLEGVSTDHARDFAIEYEARLPVNPFIGREKWLPEQMGLALQENVRLIRSLPIETLSEVRGIVQRGLLDGTRVEDMATLIAGRLDVAYSRATLIAVDQTGKWFGSMNRLRQLDADVAQYKWSTSLDEAVRPSHQAREGKTFDWSKPPSDGHPGMPVRCRCQAIAIVEDMAQEIAPKPTPTPTPAPKPRPVARPSALPAYGQPAAAHAQLMKDAVAELSKVKAQVPLVGDRHEGALPDSFSDHVRATQKAIASAFKLESTRPFQQTITLDATSQQSEALGVMGWNGTMGVRFHKDLGAESMQKTVIHELIHTMGGATTGMTYIDGSTKFLEEIATEELAQAFVGSTTKVVHIGARIPMDDVNAAIAMTENEATALVEVKGSYKEPRQRFFAIIACATGETDAAKLTQLVRESLLRWKGKGYTSGPEAMNAMLDALQPSSANQREFYRRLLDDPKAWTK
jgi:SPP1 gp7 family putative phage head morphogenesis protein